MKKSKVIKPEVKQSLNQTKLLQLRPEVYRSRQTVVWSEHAIKTPYDVIAANVKSALKNAMLGNRVVAVVLNEDDDYNALPADMLVGINNLDSVPEDRENYIVCDESFDNNYSHCIMPSADPEIPLIARRLASVLRYKQITSGAEAPKFHIICQFWKPVSSKRWKELCTSLRKNLENPFIASIHLLLESENCREAFSSLSSELQSKIVAVPWSRRLTYKDALKYMSCLPKEDLCCLANTDIFFDESVREIWNIDMKMRCLALLRYEATLDWAEGVAGTEEPQIFGSSSGRDDSQDCWIFRCGDLSSTDWSALTFTLGQAGCDNCFAGELVRRRFTVCNPALTIKTYHLHESGLRSYNENDRVTFGIYATIAPGGIMESRVLRPDSFKSQRISVNITDVANVMKWEHGQTDKAPYERGCSTLFRGASASNISFETTKSKSKQLQLINVGSEAVITNEGLIATADGIGFGADVIFSELLWNQTEYTTFSPTTMVAKTVFWPTDNTNMQIFNAGRLAWLASITNLNAIMPGTAGYMKVLYDIIGVQMTGSAAAIHVGETATGPLPDGENALILEPIVTYLRQKLQPIFEDLAKPSGWTFYATDDDIVSEFDSDNNVRYLAKSAAPIKMIRTLHESQILVSSSSAINQYLWCMQSGTTLIDLYPSLATARMATACGLKYMPLIFDHEGSAEAARIIRKSISGSSAIEQTTELPKIFVPQIKDGFHGHCGDGFREMIELWAEGGLINRQFYNGVFCWLNSVGETLLYDRDTLEWLEATDIPEAERTWRQGLFGNMQHPRGKAWIYWARRPRLLAVEAAKTEVERKNRLVFYGKIENGRQFKVRSAKATGLDWSSACDDFCMPVGGKYLYSQTEYLEKLHQARFGLCLPGYGPKCQREIECIALGTVPIITPGVDIEGYAVPLIEGTHYLRAANPEEARRLAAETSDEVWATMSAACRKYYENNLAPEAAWRLTCKLAATEN